QGEADRFREVLSAYNASRDVTATRLYLETMEDVLSKANKVIVDKNVGGALPFFPLQDALRKNSGSN
ncbi:MAG: HflK protein, partial [Proteobacteria bacterium]|nr:HflK protein [Pseudomonadota bacterium]